MQTPEDWRAAIGEGHPIRAVDDGIFSVLPDVPHAHLYDRRAYLYDLAVGTRFYNRVMWGASVPHYVAFVREAIASCSAGLILDAGCGSMLFTARPYLESKRQVLAFDQSLNMLRRARARLMKAAGRAPGHVVLLQADLHDMPFREAWFHTILCMNVLHHVADAAVVLCGLKGLLAEGGRLYLTTLVKTGRLIGDRYLDALHRSGHVVRPRAADELEDLLSQCFDHGVRCRTAGNMAYAIGSAST
jgi:SAM-dependent methyltransferase